METLDIDLTYYEYERLTELDEADCHRRSLRWELPLQQVALVLVDVWSEHYIQTHLERATRITRERIVPVLRAFRQLGALVVHGPSPDCARKYAAFLEAEVENPRPPGADWPPAEFRRREGKYASFVRPGMEQSAEYDRIIRQRRIVPEAEPGGDDRVVANGEALHRLLARRGGLFLFYMGFAANMCVPSRDYGMRAMKERGYEIVLVEDCTTAIEVGDTAGDLTLSRACAVDAALTIGYTTSSSELLEACRRLKT